MAALLPQTRNIWDHALSLGKGAKFTGPDIHKKFPKIPYFTIYNRLAFLTKKGVIRKTTSWNGENYIIYEVCDDTRVSLDLSVMKRKGNPGKQLRQELLLRTSQPQDVVSAINQVATLLENILKNVKEQEKISLSKFSTSEIFKELEIRTGPSQ
jgi:hypothetical protein